MNAELGELYQEVILDHNKNPRNFRENESADRVAHGHNPLCGDKIDVYLTLDGETITDVSFFGSGCAISKASASIMTGLLIGKTISEARVLFDEFHHIVTADTEEEFDIDEMGKLAVFSGVREFPARIKCAGLAWHTMLNAIDGKTEDGVSTE